MTSSLVGSEMCIRDSPRTRDVAGGDQGQHRVSSTHTALSASVDEAEARPVSYTHLTLPTICSV
eukprot:5582180-Prorocentrum_lima.AAC.1